MKTFSVFSDIDRIRAKGLSERDVIYKHALRNALLPAITILGLSIPGLIGGSVIFETVFAIPGKVSSLTSAGTNDLIKDGARLVQSVDDIIEELSIAEIKPVSDEEKDKVDSKISKMTKAYVYNSLTEEERKVYKILSDEPLYIDDILGKTDFDFGHLNDTLYLIYAEILN